MLSRHRELQRITTVKARRALCEGMSGSVNKALQDATIDQISRRAFY
jgi:hypothetical protein